MKIGIMSIELQFHNVIIEIQAQQLKSRKRNRLNG